MTARRPRLWSAVLLAAAVQRLHRPSRPSHISKDNCQLLTIHLTTARFREILEMERPVSAGPPRWLQSTSLPDPSVQRFWNAANSCRSFSRLTDTRTVIPRPWCAPTRPLYCEDFVMSRRQTPYGCPATAFALDSIWSVDNPSVICRSSDLSLVRFCLRCPASTCPRLNRTADAAASATRHCGASKLDPSHRHAVG